jgi:acyl-CoA thioester hydrolase
VIVQTIERAGVRLLDAEVRIAALRASDFRPRPIPDALYPQLKALQEAASEHSTPSNAE